MAAARVCAICIVVWCVALLEYGGVFVDAKAAQVEENESVFLAGKFTEGARENKVLAFLAKDVKEKDFATIFEGMKERGFDLTIAEVGDDIAMPLEAYGHLILMSDSLAGYTENQLFDYINGGGNVVLSCGPLAAPDLVPFLKMLSVKVAREYSLGDNVQFNVADKQTDRKNVLVMPDSLSNWTSSFITDKNTLKPLLVINASVQYPSKSGYVSSMLSAPRTSYAHKAEFGYKLSQQKKILAGPDFSVVTAVQTKKNSRIIVMGTAEMCKENTLNSKIRVPGTKTKMKNGNKDLCEAAFKWAFQEVGVLRATDITHYYEGTNVTKSMYSIKDELAVSFSIEEWSGNHWIAHNSDIQIEVVMLDPYIRKKLDNDSRGLYSSHFRVPDVYGVYKLVVQKFNFGLSWIDMNVEIPVRPLKSSEYDRFIPMQLPYYASLLTVVCGFFLMTSIFLYTK